MYESFFGTGADLGGKGVGAYVPSHPPPPLSDSIPCRRKGFPSTILIYTYLVTDSENAPPKNTIFFVKSYQKLARTSFLACFFKILPVAQKCWLKKSRQNFPEI